MTTETRQLFGVSYPLVSALGADVTSVISAQPVSISPDGTSALLQVRVQLTNNLQIDRHIFVDLAGGTYGSLLETTLGSGNPSNVVVKAADVVWGDGTNPQIVSSYMDLTDPIYANVSTDQWKFELLGLTDSVGIV